MIHPSIDILGGKVVQLRGGNPDDCVVALDDVHGVAEQFARYGELAIIDLDAALGRGDNLELIASLCAKHDARVGGGIRSHERADTLLRMGAKKLIIGTCATPDFLRRYPRERIIVALDAKGGEVVDHGWTQGTGARVLDRARELAPFCSEFLYTLVDREGQLGGTDLDAVRALVDATDNRVVAAGGITGLPEVMALEQMGASCQLGMAIYTGVLSLTDCILGQLDWEKNAGLIPVVVQDEHDQVVMHAWADQEAVAFTLMTGDGHYFSRSRNQHWRKGGTSGHTQRVSQVRYDCDGDTLLYRIAQTGRACHLPTQYSCFGDQTFRLSHLQTVLQHRKAKALDPATADPGSYSQRLFTEPGLVEEKLQEEVQELIEADSDREIVWEAADVIFFTLAKLARHGLTLAQVERELHGRAGRRRAPAPTVTTESPDA